MFIFIFRGVDDSSEWRVARYQTSRRCTDCVCEPVYRATARHCQGITYIIIIMDNITVAVNFMYDACIQCNLASSQDCISGIQSTVQTFKVCWIDAVCDV